MVLFNKKYSVEQEALLKKAEDNLKLIMEQQQNVGSHNVTENKKLLLETLKVFESLKVHKLLTGKRKRQYMKLKLLNRLMR